jgi:hypothetical protein
MRVPIAKSSVLELRDPKDSAKLIWQMIIKIQYVDSHND